jgi:transcriptional regulator with XRE-family HTH domain
MNPLDAFLGKSEALPDARETFADLAAKGRELAGMSLREAATEFRTAAGTVSRWENGYSAPPAIARREIIAFYRKRVRKIRDAMEAPPKTTLAAPHRISSFTGDLPPAPVPAMARRAE